MRDAIGGVVNIQMILVFIAVISGYLAFSVSYTKAVHVKDFIINKIEEYEEPPKENDKVKTDINNYMKQVGYSGVPNADSDANATCSNLATGEKDAVSIDSDNSTDYIICKFEGAPTSRTVDGKDVEVPRYYYGVVTYITVDIPVINNIMSNLRFFKISGKTRLIEEH